MEQDFLALRKFTKDDSGNYQWDNSLAPSVEVGVFNELQESFLVYNVLTSGLDYGVTNYSGYLPYALYEKLEQKYFHSLVQTIEQYPGMSPERKRNLITAFYLKIALANINKLGAPKVKTGDSDNQDPLSVIQLVKGGKEDVDDKKDFSVNKGFKLDPVTNKNVFYDLLYKVVAPNTKTIETGLEEYYGAEENNIDELAEDMNYKPEAEVEEGETPQGQKFVSFPLFIRKSNSLYMRIHNFGDSVAYQVVGGEFSVDSSLLDNPLQYETNLYFNPYKRTVLAEGTNLTTFRRLDYNLDHELTTGETFIISSKSNIYRVISAEYRVTGYDKDRQLYIIEKVQDLPQERYTMTEMPQVPFQPINTSEGSYAAEMPPLEKIVEEGKQWEDTFEEDNGKTITVEYESKTQGRITRITDGIKGFHNKYLKRIPNKKRTGDYYIEQAEKLFEGREATDTILFPRLSKQPLTKAEYIDTATKQSLI